MAGRFRAAPYFVIFDGQSMNGGWPDYVLTELVMAGRNNAAYHEPWLSGIAWSAMDDSLAARVKPYANSGLTTIYNMVGGTTDVNNGDSGATIYATMSAIAQTVKGYGVDFVVATTITPSTSHTGGEITARQNANTLIMADADGYFDYKVDLAGVSGLDDPTNETYYFDGTHWWPDGAQLAAATLDPIYDVLTA